MHVFDSFAHFVLASHWARLRAAREAFTHRRLCCSPQVQARRALQVLQAASSSASLRASKMSSTSRNEGTCASSSPASTNCNPDR